jgi:methylglutamate dehydrogenase subunit B
MLITCPHCGARPVEEFTFNGDAAPTRPRTVDNESARQWFEYVYLRDNPRGWLDEYAHHSGGCRQWLVVTRNTDTHEMKAAVAVGDYVRKNAKLT